MACEARPNRRQHLRYGDGSVQVLIRGQGLFGRMRAETRTLLDFNRFGLAFASEVEMDPGVVLTLDLDAGADRVTGVPALVCDVLPRDGAYRIGVQFTPERLRGGASQRLVEALHTFENLLKRRS